MAAEQPATDKTPRLTRAGALEEIGVSGLQRYGGVVTDEWLPELTGARAIKVFREMTDNSPVIGAFLFAVEQMLTGAGWSLKPAAEDRQSALDAAAYVESCRQDTSHSWADMLSEVATEFPYGWAFMETTYKVRRGPYETDGSLRSRFTDGRIGWRKIALRGQETKQSWEFDEAGGIKAMVQTALPDFKPRIIPIEKALLFRTRSNKNNPEGRSILRNAFVPWFYLKRIMQIEAIGTERDLAGLPMIEPPAGVDITSDAQKKAVAYAKRVLRNIRRDEQEGVLMPAGWKLSLLTTGGRRQFDTDAIVNRYNRLLLMSALAQFLMLGAEKVGSFALSITQEDLWLMAVSGWLHSIADVFNRYAIPRLCMLNDIPAEDYPTLVPAEVREPKVEQLGTFLKDMVGVGVITPDESLERYLRNLARLPAAEVVQAVQKAAQDAEERHLGRLEKARKAGDEAAIRRILEEEDSRPGETRRAQYGILDLIA